MTNTINEKYMRLCFDLAKNGSGYISPNPPVGAVIVKDDKIISTGYHKRYGSVHAERNASDNADQDLTGATLYCNLEPCIYIDK